MRLRVLVTGAAGFIGNEVALRLLASSIEVIGYDNHNDYYDPSLKEDRVRRLLDDARYVHVRGDLADKQRLQWVFDEYQPDLVIHLAAQAGVRYSLQHPQAYIDSNLVGFANILECCRHAEIRHLVFASSSSVYGLNRKQPYSVEDNVDHPISLYAATKKSNELMAHSYAHLYGLPVTGLRFFTVYGPWGRPDMAYFKFVKKMANGESIDIYNYGQCKRDFTYIDDIVEGVIRVMHMVPAPDPAWDGRSPASSSAPYRVYNIGNHTPVRLMDFIDTLERVTGLVAKKNMMGPQPGDVEETYADVNALMRDTGFSPSTSLENGLSRFWEWFQDYYRVGRK